jgi:lambda repressor-like predicted transcriptional regulator
MKKKIWIWVGGLLIALMVVGAVGSAVAYAQGPTPTAVFGDGHGPHGGRGLEGAELDAAAKALGMTTDELSTALQSGKTLEQLATEKGVDIQTVQDAIRAARPLRLGSVELEVAAKALGMTTDDLTTSLKAGKTLEQLAIDKGVDIQTVKDAIQAAHQDEMRAQIKQAVTDGNMTQEKADWLLEGLDKGFLDGPGFGSGGPRDHGFGGGSGQNPSVQPTQQNNQ